MIKIETVNNKLSKFANLKIEKRKKKKQGKVN